MCFHVGMTHAIQIDSVSKRFGDKIAVDDLHLSVPRGAMYGVIGPNGAGKSTSLRMILSILFPDSGHIRVLGADSALKAKDRIGYLPEERGVYKKMKVTDFLVHMGILKGLKRVDARIRSAQWLERVALADVGRKRCEELSKGMQQKIQFIAAVLHEPELLILDEPFSGLDPVNMRLLKELVEAQHAAGTTILFSTHVMFQAEQMCDHIVMLHNGRKVLDDTLAEIRARNPVRAVRFAPLSADAPVIERLSGLPGITGVSPVDGQFRVDLAEDVDLTAVVNAITQRVTPLRLELMQPSLEDVFIGIATGGSGSLVDTTRAGE